MNTVSYSGWVGKVILFRYKYSCLEHRYTKTPYLLILNIGEQDKQWRLSTPEECKDKAEELLTWVKQQLNQNK